MICLETAFLVDYLNEDPENPGPAGRYLGTNETETFSTSAISLHEVLYGVATVAADTGRGPSETVADRIADLDFIDTLPFDDETTRDAALLRADLRSDGNDIPMNDAYIAATARLHGYPLVCADEHFDRVPDLDTIRYK